MKKVISLLFLIMLIGILAACGGPKYEEGITFKTEQFELADVAEDEFLLYFMSSSCSYCQAFRPVLNEYAKQDNALPIYAMDLDDKTGGFEAARYFVEEKGFSVTGTPTTFYIKDGEAIAVVQGKVDLEQIPVKGDYKKFLEEMDKQDKAEEGNSTETELTEDEVEEGENN